MSENCKPKTGTLEWASKNVNYLNGCKNNCVYCYAAGMANRFGRKKRADWANMEYPTTLAERKLPRNTRVMFPSSHDLFLEHYPSIFHYLTLLLDRGNTVLIVSKPRKDVIRKIILDFKDWHKDQLEFRFSITSASNEISLKYEPGASLPQERVDCLKMVLDAGFPASVSMEPYLEPPRIILRFIGYKTCEKLGEIWIGGMNYGVPPELRPLYTPENMKMIYNDYSSPIYPNIRWKDSFQRALGIDCHGRQIE